MKLYPCSARYTDFENEIALVFSEAQVDMLECETCGERHPPEIHLRPVTPFDPSEPEEA